jgi:MYXO-CTERM domain-containing protein
VVGIGIANNGNTTLKPAGNLTIHDHDGKTVAEAPVTMASFYAHSDTKIETPLGGKLQPGNYTVSITLTDPTTKTTATGTELPFTVADTALANTDSSSQPGQLPRIIQDAGAGPTPYLIGAGLLAALAALFLLIRRKRNLRPYGGGTENTTPHPARESRPTEHARRD